MTAVASQKKSNMPQNSHRHLARRALWPLCATLWLAGCQPGGAPPAGAGPGPGGPGGGPPPAMPVAVRTISLQAVPVLIEAVGQAEGSKDVEVRARIGGLVERQLYKEGERLRAGAPMFTIERAPFEIALAQARAVVAQEQVRLEQVRREAARLQPLAAMQAIPQREADDAASALKQAEAALATAQLRIREAELNLSYTQVVAPIAGLSGRAEKSVGSLVGPADGLLARITQTDPIWVRFAFSEDELAQLRRGKPGPVRLLDAEGRALPVRGRLDFTGSSVDPRLGTVQLRAELPNPGLTLLPGQFVRAQVQTGEQRAALVPQSAVMTGGQGRSVWTVQDGKAVSTPVEVGGWYGADWIVKSGLKDGDQVIVDNLIKLRPGAPVAAKPATPAAPAAAASAATPAAAASR